jgi:tetratricopeptide (TPR) repeat protein
MLDCEVPLPLPMPTLPPELPQLAQAELARLCAHKQFRRSLALQRLLAFLVDAELNHVVPTEALLAQSLLGLDGSTFHPYTNSHIRVNMLQLRKRLAACYNDLPPSPLRFHLPHGSFRLRLELTPPSNETWRRAWSQANLLSGSRYVDDLETALQRIDQVLTERPRFAPAYALRSHCHLRIGSHGGDPVPSARLAREAAAQAANLDPEAWESLAATAHIAGPLDFQWDHALALYSQAAAISSNEVWASPWYQVTLIALNQLDLCLQQMKQALIEHDLPPRSLQQNYGAVLHLAGRFDEAEEELAQTAEVFPTDFSPWLWRGIQALAQGRRAKALVYLAQGVVASHGRVPGTVIQAGFDFLRTGQYVAPAAHVGGCVECSTIVTSSANGTEEAIGALGRMIDARNPITAVYIRLPLLARYHHHPRFLALFDRMGIPGPSKPGQMA